MNQLRMKVPSGFVRAGQKPPLNHVLGNRDGSP